MENDWDLYIDLDKYVYKLEENKDNKENKENYHILSQLNKNNKPGLRKVHYLYTIIEEKEYDNEDFFKKSPIAEKNKYANYFSQYKLKTNKVK